MLTKAVVKLRTGDCQIVGSSLACVAENPAPVSVEPVPDSAVIACMPGPARPALVGAAAVQPAAGGVARASVQITTFWLPAAP